MNPILLLLTLIYLIVILTKNIFSNKDLIKYTTPIVANVIISIRKNLDNIYLTIFTMLGLITYFSIIGVDMNRKSKKEIQGEFVIEKYENLGKDIDEKLSKEKNKDKELEEEYANAHNKVIKNLSSIERDKECRKKNEETCEIDNNCIWCIGPDKGCYGGSSAGITHRINNEKCNHFMYNNSEYKHVKDGFGITQKIN